MTTTLYGIKNCDTVRKARRWLEQHHIEYHFHDVREDGLSSQLLQEWGEALGWETLLNRRSTTWKQLSPAERDNLGPDQVQHLLLQYPTLLKRPLLSHGSNYLQGFDPALYQDWFKHHTL